MRKKVLFADSGAEVSEGSSTIRKLIKDGATKNETELSKFLHPKVLKYVKENDIFSKPKKEERERERDKKPLTTTQHLLVNG